MKQILVGGGLGCIVAVAVSLSVTALTSPGGVGAILIGLASGFIFTNAGIVIAILTLPEEV